MDKTEIKSKKFKSQSFTNFLDILNPSQSYLRSRNCNVVLKTSCNNCCREASKYNQPTQPNQTLYITSENYHALNRNGSHKSIIRSTSTFFYDLDKIVKRHSCHYFTRKDSDNKISKCYLEEKSNKNGFRVKNDTVVQDCAAQIQSKLKVKNNLKLKQNKAKKISRNPSLKYLEKPSLTSEIYLNDNNTINDNIYVKQEDKYLQKFWSFAKYKTEYAYPLKKEKKSKKNDHSKQVENPCPCQLFSYACPCTDKKSLTELAKNSKVLTVADQITSTTYFLQKTSSQNISSNIENIKDTNNSESIKTAEEFQKKSDEIKNTPCKPSIVTSTCTKNSTNIKNRPQKKSQKLICPRCKEKLEILSTTEDECSIISRNIPLCRNSCLETETYNTNNVENNDVCNHNPPCELVPICQILPHENECVNAKHVENVSVLKHNPRLIRITKACRHHPPCTVVPSCQKINVLKNNCEFIPPCLHHPRCVNVPLCVPVFKNLYYDDIFDKPTEDKNKMERNLSPKYKYITELQHDSLNNNNVYPFHSSQNKCQCFGNCSPKGNLQAELSYAPPTSSLYQMPLKLPLNYSKSTKSCQYDCLDCKCYTLDDLQENDYIETVVYIRDVGCQFKNNNPSPTNSLLYSRSSKLFYDFNTETNKFYTTFYKPSYKDKYTNPVSGEELSMSTFTSSFEVDEHCPSHGTKQAYRKGSTGFIAKNPYVTAYANLIDPIFPYKLSSLSDNAKRKIDSSSNIETCSRLHTEFVKSRRSIRKKKYKNIFSVKRRRKIRSSSNSKKINVC